MAARRRLTYPLPRWQTPMPGGVVGSWGPDVARWSAAELGLELDLWQRRALNRALAVDAAGQLAHRIFLASTGRQNGKTVGVRALVGWALTTPAGPAWSTIYGLAFDKKQARIPYRLVAADLTPLARRLGPAARGGLSVTTYLGIRSGMHGRPRQYDVASREAASALRGESIDLGIFDEVRTQRDHATWNALLPATSARPEPLLFLISSAGDDRSTLLRELFDRGLRIIDGAEPAGGFGMSWYAARDDDEPTDPAAWARANPAMLEGRLTESTIRAELYGLTPAAFRAERLNLWVDELGDAWLPPGVWARLAGPQPMTPDELAGARITLGVEAAPTWRRASIAVTLRLEDGRAWTGLVADLEPTSSATTSPDELVDALAVVAGAWHPSAIAYSSTAAAAPAIGAYAAAAGIPGIALTAGQIRSASELLRAELVGGRLTHADDPLLASQVRSSRPSSPIDAGGWYISVRESLAEVDAVRAVAWSAWAALAPEAIDTEPQVF